MRRFGSDASFQGADEPANSARRRTPTAGRAAGATQARQGYPRLRLHQRFLPLLVAITLISTFGLASLAYLGTRTDAISAAQTQALQDAQVERQLLSDEGAAITVQGGNLTVGVDNNATALNGDTSLVDRTRSVVGVDATIYQLEGPDLVAIATNLPRAGANGHAISGSRALGDTLSGPGYDALLGNCGAIETANCHQQYAGVVSVHGISYVAGYIPLFDINGAFVGALSAATPLDTVVAPSIQLAVVLLLIGLLVALGGLVMGFWLFGSLSRNVLQTLDAGLATVAESAGELERLARAQVERAGRHSRTALQVSEQVRALDNLAGVMSQGHGALRESAGEIWAEMSQPGLNPNAELMMSWAQQAAIMAGKVGGSAAEARDRCRQLVMLMNHILAESSVAGESGSDIERHARALRESVGQVEQALGTRLIQRPSGLSLPLLRRGTLRAVFGQGAGRPTAGVTDARALREQAAREQAAMRQQQTGNLRAVRPGQTGAIPVIRPEQLRGQSPYATGKFPAQPGMNGQTGKFPTQPQQQQGMGGQTGQHRVPGPSHSGRILQPGEWNMPPSANGNSQRRPKVPSTPLNDRTGKTGNTGGPAADLGLPGLPEEYRSRWRMEMEDGGDKGDAGDSGNAGWLNDQE